MLNARPSPAQMRDYPYYEIYQMQIYLAKDGWPKYFVEIGDGTGLKLLAQLVQESKRIIPVAHFTDDHAIDGAESVKNGSVNFVFLNCALSYERMHDVIGAWWQKIKVSGWMGGSDIRPEPVSQALKALFRTQYPPPDQDYLTRVVQVGWGWLVPKLQEPINFPWKGEGYFR